eukprot:gb/GEZN01006885.1/.p1 GENE.gb/GEZN01006885.1/~~gb/GEZN01006885.1/.p1  ORF type:complete len:480 (+),score=26.26 gb/GEZN01006885.1/:45-1484(+)
MYKYTMWLPVLSILLSFVAIVSTFYHMRLGASCDQPPSFFSYFRPRIMISSCLVAFNSSVALWLMDGQLNSSLQYTGPFWVLPLYTCLLSLSQFTLCDILTVYVVSLLKVLQAAVQITFSIFLLRWGLVVLGICLALVWVLYVILRMAWCVLLSNCVFLLYVALLVPVTYYIHWRVNSIVLADTVVDPRFKNMQRLLRKFRNILTVSFLVIVLFRIIRESVWVRFSAAYYEHGYEDAVKPASDIVSLLLYNFALMGFAYMSLVFLRESQLRRQPPQGVCNRQSLEGDSLILDEISQPQQRWAVSRAKIPVESVVRIDSPESKQRANKISIGDATPQLLSSESKHFESHCTQACILPIVQATENLTQQIFSKIERNPRQGGSGPPALAAENSKSSSDSGEPSRPQSAKSGSEASLPSVLGSAESSHASNISRLTGEEVAQIQSMAVTLQCFSMQNDGRDSSAIPHSKPAFVRPIIFKNRS